MSVTLLTLQSKKQSLAQISMITCYDYKLSYYVNQSKIDVILVGDSVGTNHLGYSTEKEVTIEDMIHHTKAVCRASTYSFVVTDLPYKTYTTKEIALSNANRLIKSGAQAIKFEGFFPDIVKHLVAHGVPCVCHLGLLCQTASKKKVQANTKDLAFQLLDQAKILEQCGASLLILELVPEEVAKKCASILKIPVIGIGAGRYCDGQVQVIYDILGLSERKFKHVPTLPKYEITINSILSNYHKSVLNKTLLDNSNCFNVDFSL